MNKNSEKVVRWRIRLKEKLIAYKGGKCSKCGYSKNCPPAYDFHHRNPAHKEFKISGATIGFERMKTEVDKCDLVCRNCHAEIHDEEWKINRKKIIENVRVIFRGTPKLCGGCKTMFSPKRAKQKFCSKRCSGLRKDKPTPVEIDTMLQTMTWTAIGKKYGVSDNAVRKWYRK